jgi:diguanylate cyclase (GGDEF)-like protein
MRTDFNADELRLFASLANTLSSRLTNDHLVGLLENQARTDALTGLPNRLSFETALTAKLARTRQSGAVVMIDLDRFKEINDSLGHATGDRLLIEIGDRLRRFARSTDMIARFGGDEFAIMLGHSTTDDAEDLTWRVEELHTILTGKVQLEGITFEIGASLGAVNWPEQGNDSTSLLRRADTAMYEAKRNQLGVLWYQPELDADAPRRLDLYLSVSNALLNDEFYVHFQPKVSLVDGRLTGAEALVRWTHPAHGPVPPAEFIPLVIQAGLIGRLTRLVFRRAAEAAAMLRSAGFEVPIAVNLTPRDLLDAGLIDDLVDILATAHVPASALQIEITENAMVVDFEMSVAVLEQLREMGITVAIDDFGTGYSSLQHLHRLPIDQLKIDRSFISRLTSDDSAAAIVRASVNLANDLGLVTVAEGVEDSHTLSAIALLGCSEIQGYLIGRPMAIHDLVWWAREWDPLAVIDRLIEPSLSPDPRRLVAAPPSTGSYVPQAAVVRPD